MTRYKEIDFDRDCNTDMYEWTISKGGHDCKLNSHLTRKGNAWKFVKTLHIKFFSFGCGEPSRWVTVKNGKCNNPSDK